MSIDFLISIMSTSLSAVGAIIAGLLFEKIFKKRQSERKKAVTDIEEIAQIAEKHTASDTKKIIESIDAYIIKTLSNAQSSPEVDLLRKNVSEQPISYRLNPIFTIENLITNYHEQALNQARVQFWFSVGAATIGFIWIIIYGIMISPQDIATIAKVLPGVVIDAVAGLFFKQAADTRRRATELYDRLRQDKKNDETMKMVSSIDDNELRNRVKAQIALNLSKSEDIELDSIIKKRKTDEKVIST
jgi:uncharacterized membrane protein YraQ (UPF0718 family)